MKKQDKNHRCFGAQLNRGYSSLRTDKHLDKYPARSNGVRTIHLAPHLPTEGKRDLVECSGCGHIEVAH